MRAAPAAVAALLGPALLAGPAHGAVLRDVELADPSAGAVSRPFALTVGAQSSSADPAEVRIAVDGFAFDDGQAEGRRIGSVDYDTNQGLYPGNFMTTGGGGTYRLEIPTTTGQTSVPVAVRPGTGLDDAGALVPRAGATALAFTLPDQLPLDARVRAITLRFNAEGDRGPRNGGNVRTPTPDVGATNPGAGGTYAVRAWVRARDGSSALGAGSVTITAPGTTPPGTGAPGTGDAGGKREKVKLAVKWSRRPVRPGARRVVRIRVRRGAATRVAVKRGRRVLKRVRVKPGRWTKYRFRARKRDAGRTVKLRLVPKGGPARTVKIRVARR